MCIITVYTPDHRADCLAAFTSNIPQFFAPDELPDFERFLTRIESGNDTAHFYVVAVDEKVIGCGGYGDKAGDGVFSLAWGLIHRDFHKRGLGVKLLLHRIEQIKQLNPTASIVLDTTQYSCGFFEKFGFQTIKVTEDYYAAGLHRYDMELSTSENYSAN